MSEHQNKKRVEDILRRRCLEMGKANERDPRYAILARDLTSHGWDKVDRALSDVVDLVDDPVLAAFICMDIGALVLGTSMVHMMGAAMAELQIPLSREAMHAIRNNVLVNVNKRLSESISNGSFDMPQPMSERNSEGD